MADKGTVSHLTALDELRRQRPEGCLYHYTDQKGLLGVTTKKVLWATNVRYLNDAAEFSLAVELAKSVLDQKLSVERDPRKRGALEEMRYGTEYAGINVCVCSFSDAKDQLSQWRAYCGERSGFALGFSYSVLADIAERNYFTLVPCLYEPARQRALMTEIVREALDGVLEMNVDDRVEGIPGGDFVYWINRYAAVFKHFGFEEEREWRLISKPLNARSAGYEFREGRSNLIPYYKLPITTANGNIDIKEVLLGPTPHPELAKQALSSLLRVQNLRDTVIHESAIPFRNW